MTDWITVVFMQGEDADEAFAMLYDIDGVVLRGPTTDSLEATIKHLAQWDYGEESDHTVYDREPWGWAQTHEMPYDNPLGYVLAWDYAHGHISLHRPVPPACPQCHTPMAYSGRSKGEPGRHYVCHDDWRRLLVLS